MFKVLNVKEWVISHILLVGGLVLFTIGLLMRIAGLTVAGIWVVAAGFCYTSLTIASKLLAK